MCRRCVMPFMVIMLCFAGCEKESKGVVGVWQIKEIQNAPASIKDKPVPSLFIFTIHHYSMLWVLSAEPNKPFAQRWKPTDAEKIERFNSLIVNAGTYEIDGSTLTMHPLVARIPDFMGGKQMCEYRIEHDTMQLKFVDEYSLDGVQAPWVKNGSGLILTLVRID